MNSPFSVTFANPSWLLSIASDLLSPLRFVRHLVWPFAVFALIAGYFNWYVIQENLDIALGTFTLLQNLVISMLTANLFSRLVMGLTMSYLGIPPQQFGIRLFFGVIPRFYVSTGQIRQLDFSAQRTCYAAPLLARLGLFAFGIITWVLIRRSGTGVADVVLVLGATGLAAFLFTLNPIWRADGYHWMAAWFRMPDLREQSYRLFGLILRGKPIPPMLSAQAIRGLLFYAVASIVFTAGLLLLVLTVVATALEEQYRGTGVVMFALILSMMLAFLINRSSGRKDKQRQIQRRAIAETSHPGDVTCYTSAKAISDEAEPLSSEKMANKRRRTARPVEWANTKGEPDALASGLDDILSDTPSASTPPPADLNAELEDILGPPSSPTPPRAPKDEFDAILEAALTPPPVAARVTQPDAPHPAPPTRNNTFPPQPRASDDLDKVLKLGKSRRTRGSRLRRLLFWVLMLGGLYWIAIQPYPFSVGGDFTVSPLERTQIRARTNGEIEEIYVREGDWVTKGQRLALLTSWEESSNVAIQEADLVRLEANLESLTAAPKAEEIELAEQNLQAALLREQLAEVQKKRVEALANNGISSVKSLEEAKANYDLAVNVREQAEARLNLLKSPVPESDIEAAKANIQRKKEELNLSKLRLEQTVITAPSDGQVVSPMQKISIGAFLREGDLLAELADNRVVMAEIEVPETEIGEAAIGAEVTLKLWRAPDQSITGIVKRVAPAAEEREFGRVVRVIVEVPNPDGKISRNLTGYGKIIVEERPVWEVFSRVFIRFFKIEIWSWLP
jgi:multidrug efflux pump subunit AcrA (membrane-fusion protein)